MTQDDTPFDATTVGRPAVDWWRRHFYHSGIVKRSTTFLLLSLSPPRPYAFRRITKEIKCRPRKNAFEKSSIQNVDRNVYYSLWCSIGWKRSGAKYFHLLGAIKNNSYKCAYTIFSLWSNDFVFGILMDLFVFFCFNRRTHGITRKCIIYKSIVYE